jgi:acetyl esterase/lipase
VEKKTPTFEEMIRLPLVLRVPGMDAVSTRRDVVYKTAGDHALHMDVYSPSGPARPRPGVLLVHGGPLPKLGAKNMGVFRSYGAVLAASGYVAVAFDHRFLGPDRLVDAEQDVEDLVSHVRAKAASLGVDAERLAIWAFSGLLSYYAVLDLQQPPPGADSGLSAELRERFSPVAALGDARSAPPLLVARAGLDHPWLNGGADRFVQEALAKGATLDLLNHPDGRHAFDILDDDARTREILRRTLGFLRDRLSPETAP